ncbi:molybdopterin biosynthesis protein MoeA [Clostridium carboxidivorans P7]|uniref:Molybdopterin molybdenumtransferase n=1 Tax=Clostridium carboxidivorans P7 TaxID=536227 RepID=C6PXE9_9CLOT|nr:molybdenum cofactor synthesis domain-containing protein [Clostridium carboxidivorans]AKN31679.1 molybdopterin biosynthesis protein MoeA [Clostridium carboxidivorans P7]EET86075.1 molybdenum cofactor synthesis domain protein [Clostridium carboxidivorans P7]EFG87498.1 molybdenum cofactor synthesis domain protein [Clostridium carboxidivorans P7]
MDFYKVLSVEEVKDIIKSKFSLGLGKELVDLEQCNDRILYEDIVSPLNIPGFKRSIVDGYAVKCRDVQGASESIPSMLELKGEVIMGKMPSKALEFPGECMYIPTGGMLPEGADSVVMIEYTDKMDDDTILVNKSVSFGENVLNEDEDVELGETVLKAGTLLKPYSISMLSSLGIIKVPVVCKPKVGIISTGDEIIAPEEYPKPGQIRDINSYLLYSSVIEDGGEPIFYGVIRDDYDKLFENVRKANEECDLVLISGGSSVGKKDETARVIDGLGDPGILLHGIAIKPGKPTILGKVKDKPIFGLPGHPLSCAVVYRIIVRYLLQRMMKFEEVEYPIPCKFSTNYHKAKGREEYLPVTIENIEGEYIAIPVLSKSAVISGFTKAWGYVKIDKNVEGIFKDQQVYVYKFQR